MRKDTAWFMLSAILTLRDLRHKTTSHSSFFVIKDTSFHHWNNTKDVLRVRTCLQDFAEHILDLVALTIEHFVRQFVSPHTKTASWVKQKGISSFLDSDDIESKGRFGQFQ